MLFDVRVLVERPGAVLALLAAFLVGKGLIAILAAMAMRFPARVAWLCGVGLAQFGEFGFVLSRLGVESSVVSAEAMKPLLAAGVVSMFVTPALVRAAPHMRAGERLLAPLERLIGVRGLDEVAQSNALSEHVVIVGYGVAGRLTAAVLSASNVPYAVLELNAETVRAAKSRGEPVYYADATSSEALEHAHLSRARALVLLINDARAAERVVDAARRAAPRVPVLMRTHYLADIQGLLRTGARDVVAEEVEGAAEVSSRLLSWLDVPSELADERVKVLLAAELQRNPV
jgi:CPA2 family monovalent cation:H+ antiporter-2